MGDLIQYLARAAREARERGGKAQRHIAQVGDFDPARVSAFENGQWPRDPERMLNAYAACLGLSERAIVERALELWAAAAIEAAAEELAPNDEAPD